MNQTSVLFLLLLLAIPYNSWAQRTKYEDLVVKLENTTDDSLKFASYIELADIFLYDKPDSSKKYVDQAYKLAIGLQNQLFIGYAKNRYGAVEWSLGNLSMAFEKQNEALDIAIKLGDNNLAAKCQLNIASLFSAVGENLLSIAYTEQTLPYFEATQNTNRLIASYNNIGKSYLSIMEIDSAKLKLEKAIGYVDAAHEWMKPIILFNLAEIQFQNGQIEASKISLSEQLALSEKYQDNRAKCRGFQLSAEIALRENDLTEAIRYADMSLALAKSSNVKELLYICHYTSAKVMAARGDFDKAYLSEKIAKQYEDSVKGQVIKNQLAYYNYRKVSNELEQLRSLNEINKLKSEARQSAIIGLIAIIILIFAAMISVFALFNKNRNANILLSQKNQQIENQHHELKLKSEELKELNHIKDRIISLMSHDFKSPLISLNSLISMLNSNLISETEFKELIPTLNESLESTSSLLENLLAWSKQQLNGDELPAEMFDVRKVADEVLLISKRSYVEKSIDIENSIQENCFGFADPGVFQIVLRNILSNATKFTPEGGQIKLSSEQHLDQISVNVQDNGVGMSQEQIAMLNNKTVKPKIGTKGEKGSGIGLILCKELIEKSGGKLDIDSLPNKGTRVSIFIPKNEMVNG